MGKEISLKKKIKNTNQPETIASPQETYPSFTIYEDAPQALLNAPMGSVLVAKIKKTSEEKRIGPNGRKSVGFDVVSVSIPESAKVKPIDQIFGDE